MSEDWKKTASRKAHVAENRCAEYDEGKKWAVFMYTLHLGKWYFDGYSAHHTREEAVAAREVWLNQT